MPTTASPLFGFSSVIAGALRVAGFFALILLFIPVHVVAARITDPFRTPRIFHRCLIRLLGFKIRIHGEASAAPPTLFVANHSSYMDIPVLGSIIPAAFVAKAEVARWPLISSLARMQNTVFIERRKTRTIEQRDGMNERLLKNQNLILFPEGTSSDGIRTLPFKSGLFSIAETVLPDGRAVTVQPVAVVCTALGGFPMDREWRPYYAWYGDMTLVRHLWNVFRLGEFTMDVIFHPPVTLKDFSCRKALALHCQRKIAESVERCVTGRISASPQMR